VADVRARVVSAFHATAATALAGGDRPLQEHLNQTAAWLDHPDTSDRVLAAFLRHITDTTTAPEG
jgi:hypothetical protein